MISLKGPLEAPKRTIDVAALASWLALRAVEQQSKKLDVLEGREPPPSPPKSEAAPAAPASPAGALPEAASSAASATPTPARTPDGLRQPVGERAIERRAQGKAADRACGGSACAAAAAGRYPPRARLAHARPQ